MIRMIIEIEYYTDILTRDPTQSCQNRWPGDLVTQIPRDSVPILHSFTPGISLGDSFTLFFTDKISSFQSFFHSNHTRSSPYSPSFSTISPDFSSFTPFSETEIFGVRKLKSMGYGVACVILRLVVFVQYRHVTDRQTDRRTDKRWQHTTLA